MTNSQDAVSGMRVMFEGLFLHAWSAFYEAAWAILIPLPFFVLLALIVKRRKLFDDVRRSLPESKINIGLNFLDTIAVAPFLTVLAVAMSSAKDYFNISIVPASTWDNLPPVLVGFAAVLLGDFIAYWRHRLEHTPVFWPSHAIHHSDTEMTWLAIFRFHPINRLTTAVIDFAFLLAMGLPPYALLVNNFVRHYYGALIHADLPWTYGAFSKVFVSPAMHRWHHSIDKRAYNTNFATVFSIFDRAFGTYRVPGVCDTPLGVPDDIGTGVADQWLYPLRPSSYRYLINRLRRKRVRDA